MCVWVFSLLSTLAIWDVVVLLLSSVPHTVMFPERERERERERDDDDDDDEWYSLRRGS